MVKTMEKRNNKVIEEKIIPLSGETATNPLANTFPGGSSITNINNKKCTQK
jgi:hypothetical protein